MKYKILDKEAIYLAGVVHYGPLTEHRSFYKGPKSVHIPIDDDFKNEMAQIKMNAKQIRDQVREQMRYPSQSFEMPEMPEMPKMPEPPEVDQEKPDMQNFEGALHILGETMENLGKYVNENAPKWEAGLQDWSENFEKNMEDFGVKMDAWGQEFGSKMDAWGENFGRKMEDWSKSFAEAESKCASVEDAIRNYPIFYTYEQVYEKFIEDHEDHIKKQTFYEVQIMDDTMDDGVADMVMVGSRMQTLENLRYPVATMVFEPDRWVAVKMTSAEYQKDWQGSLGKVEQLKNYKFDPYFIIRHRKEGNNGEVRLFLPVRERRDER